ncbi:MAG: SLC13 family permease [Nitrospiraceae bacterium]|nr:SLC13 family permease [Nitrospiraceae bacterium]
MTLAAWATLAVLLAVVILSVNDRADPAFVLAGAVGVLLLVGVLTPPRALDGFANPAVLAIGCLFVLVRAVERSSFLRRMAELIYGADGNTDGVKPLGIVALISAFVPNATVVAVLMPAVRQWARRVKAAPSRLLMPAGFAATLGGMLTLIGTSSNLVVNGMLLGRGDPGFGFFELGAVGLPVAVIGIVYMAVAAPRLLVDRPDPIGEMSENPREYIGWLRVTSGGPFDGVPVGELRSLEDLFVAGIERNVQSLTPVEPSERIHGGDILMLVGRVEGIAKLAAGGGLAPVEGGEPGLDLVEAVVSPSSPMIGRNIRESGFRGRYDAVVLAVHRHGEHLREKIGDIIVQPGDMLLVAAGKDFLNRWRYARDFYVVSPTGRMPKPATLGSWIAPAILVAVVIAAATGALGLVQATVAGVLAIVLTGQLRPSEVWAALPVPTLIMIAASISLSHAVMDSGCARELAGLVLGGTSHAGPFLIVAIILAAAALLTEIMDNPAAAAIIFPLAVAGAAAAHVSLHAAAAAVAVGVSTSFLTPFGYHANLIVAGAGGYRFRDFLKFGLPLKVLCLIVAGGVIPLVW